MALPRRYSALPLPAYRHVPGRTPHPVRDRRGHSFGREERAEVLEPERWPECETYLFGIDLLNLGYWWEAHEAFEGLWRAAGRGSELGLLLQGLIQVAASLLKQAMDAEGPARNLATLGCEKLRRAPQGLLGIDGLDLAVQVEAHLEGRRREAPVVVLQARPLLDEARDRELPPGRGGPAGWRFASRWYIGAADAAPGPRRSRSRAMSESFHFDVALDVPYPEALDRVTEALGAEGFGVLTRIDVHEAFQKKLGVEFRPYTILGACNPSLAHRALAAAAEVGLLLPCNVTVEAAPTGGSLVRILDPEEMMRAGGFQEGTAMAEAGHEARARLRRVADALAGSGG